MQQNTCEYLRCLAVPRKPPLDNAWRIYRGLLLLLLLLLPIRPVQDSRVRQLQTQQQQHKQQNAYQ